MPDLFAVIARDYQDRLHKAGVPREISKRTPDQQAAAHMVYLGLTLEVSSDSRLAQDSLEAK